MEQTNWTEWYGWFKTNTKESSKLSLAMDPLIEILPHIKFNLDCPQIRTYAQN